MRTTCPYRLPEYDRILVESTHELDKDKRLALVRQAELRMLQAEPIIPLYWYTNVFLIDPRVREWHPKLVDQRPMKFVYLEESP